MSNRLDPKPKRWTQVKKSLEADGWELNRISGSHHIFTKSECRCIPVAVHGGTISPQNASRVLEQAGIRNTKQEIFFKDKSQERFPETNGGKDDKAESFVSTKKEKKILSYSKQRPTRAQREADALKSEQDKILLDQFKELKTQMSENRVAQDNKRSDLLERIQVAIAMGDFKMAIRSTEFIENVEYFGSSSDAWQFNTDALFYRTVALSEHALSCCAFNSTEQQQQIRDAFILLTRFMESSPERRAESRDFALNLQRRIVRSYTNGLLVVLVELNCVTTILSKNEQALAMAKLMMPPSFDFDSIVPSLEKRTELMDQLVHGFEFIVSITKGRQNDILFKSLGEKDLHGLTPVIHVCVGKMLTSFDAGDYDTALRLSGLIYSFSNEYAAFLGLMDSAVSTFEGVLPTKSQELLTSIARHVEALIPAYRFCNQSLQWRRVAGFAAGLVTVSETSIQKICFGGVLEFLEKLRFALSTPHADLKTLVVNIETRRFIFDTFSDAVVLAKIALDKMLSTNKNVSRRVLPLIQEYSQERRNNPSLDVDEVILRSPQQTSELRKAGYDAVRVQSVQLAASILKIMNIYDSLFEVDPAVKQETTVNNKVFLESRFFTLPHTLSRLVLFMKLMFGPAHFTVALLCQTIVMDYDLATAENFNVSLEEGGVTVGQTTPAGQSPEAVRAYGVWSFTISINTFLRHFLSRFVLHVEMNRLLVIDRICEESVFLEPPNKQVESLAFGIISKLVELPVNQEIPLSVIERALTLTMENPTKRWVVDEARRLGKLVANLQQKLHNPVTSGLVHERSESVGYLLQRLQASVQAHRKVPQNLVKSFTSTAFDPSSDEYIVQASEYLIDWTHEEVHSMRLHLFRLEELSQIATGLLSTITGGAFPEVFAITGPRWTMGNHTKIENEQFTFETQKVIRDFECVRAILDMWGRQREDHD